VIGKNVYLEPQNWLLEVRNLASTPSGDPSRIEDRISSINPMGVNGIRNFKEQSIPRKF